MTGQPPTGGDTSRGEPVTALEELARAILDGRVRVEGHWWTLTTEIEARIVVDPPTGDEQ